MGVKSLEKDLKYNIINFKQIVLVTDLLNEYKLPYAEVERLLESQLSTADENYEKMYLVQGFESNTKHEIYTIVPEKELHAALKKLENVKSNLYSVELCGGSKSVPQSLKPLTYATIVLKDATKVVETTEQDVKIEEKAKEVQTEAKQRKTLAKPERVSPENKKVVKKPLAEKGQIKRGASPKKLNDFFKKNVTKASTAKSPRANESMQLFEDEEDEERMALEETEKQDKLRCDLVDTVAINIDDDDDDDDDEVIAKANSSKRRRIFDSEDEEEQPHAKQDKLIEEKQKAIKEKIEPPGTYTDEEGFVLTVKPKNQNGNNTPIRSSPRKPAAKPTPIKKTPIKRAQQQKKTASKSKQGNIMSFFAKK